MRTGSIINSFLFVVALAAGAAEAPRPLVIAAEDWPPFEYIEKGVHKGINVEIITRIMGRLNIPFELKFYPFTRSLMLLQKGKVDAIPDISYEPYRDDDLYYTDEQRHFLETGKIPTDHLWVAEYVGFINSRYKDALHFESYAQIKADKYRVGVVKNYSYNKEFRAAEMERRMYNTAREAMRGLAMGEVDMVPMERTVGTWIARKAGVSESLTHVAKPFFSKPYHLAFSRRSDYPQIEKIWQAFNAELLKMRETGEYESIYEHYIRPDYYARIRRPLTFVCEAWAPFEYLDGNQLKGIDVDVTDSIMKRLGIPYEIKIYPWSRAWMMAQKGKADAVLSISYKSSREGDLYYTKQQREFAVTGELPPDYLWTSEYVFFVKEKNAAKYKFESYEQIKQDGLRVGRNKDYSYDKAFLAAQFDGEVFSGTKEGLLSLVEGEIDLYPMDKTVGRAALRALGLENSVTWLPKPLFSKPYLAPFCRKSDFPEIEQVMRAFNRELRLMRANGEYQRLYDGYFNDVLQSGKSAGAN